MNIDIHCPNCGDVLSVPIWVATVEFQQQYAKSDRALIVQLKAVRALHSCPDPTEDAPRCGVGHPLDDIVCVRDRGHSGQHGYAGIFW